MQISSRGHPPGVIVPLDHLETLAPRIAQVIPGVRVVGIDARARCTARPWVPWRCCATFPTTGMPRCLAASASTRCVAALPSLRLIQLHSAGVDGLVTPALRASACALCNAAPLHSGPMAEMVLALMLAAAKRIPFHARNQTTHTWQRTTKLELAGSTVGIVGYGRIGQRVGELCRAFGMRVVALRQSVGGSVTPGVDRVVGPEGLRALLAESDWVVLTVPLTAATRGLIGAGELEAMKSSARASSTSRAARWSTSLPSRSACATAGSPTPASTPSSPSRCPAADPLWDLPNVLVTPHNSASSQHMEARVFDLFIENLGHLVRGEPLRNEIDKAAHAESAATPG